MDSSNEIINQITIELEQNYKDEQFRLGSFGPWFNKEVDKEQLARAGFFYLSERDHVKCVFCEVQIGGWMRGDNPFVEHNRHSPNCAFLNDDPVNNSPILKTKHLLLEELALLRYSNSSDLSTSDRRTKLEKLSIDKITKTAKHSSYADKIERLKSFVNWPTSLKQTPEELSEAGFFYLGVGDEVKCFYCGGCLRNFVGTDLALNEHKKHFFDRCKYIQFTYKNLKSNTFKLENKRPIKATNEQLQHLVEYMKQYERQLNEHFSHDRVAYTQAWKDLTETLNDLDGAIKDIKGWKEVWRNYKYNQKRKTALSNKIDKTSATSISTISYVDTLQMDISEKLIEPNDGNNLASPEIRLTNYMNIDVQNSNVSLQPTIYSLVSELMQDDEPSYLDVLDREIMQIRLKLEELNLEIEKYNLELDMKIRKKELIQKQNELQIKWREIEKHKTS